MKNATQIDQFFYLLDTLGEKRFFQEITDRCDDKLNLVFTIIRNEEELREEDCKGDIYDWLFDDSGMLFHEVFKEFIEPYHGYHASILNDIEQELLS